MVSEERNVGDVDTLGWFVDLVELSGSVSVDEGGLSDTTITNHDELELGNEVDRCSVWDLLHLLIDYKVCAKPLKLLSPQSSLN